MFPRPRFPSVRALFLAGSVLVSATFAQQRVVAVDSSLVDMIWSGHPVAFSFIGKGDSLYAAYYRGNTRQMIVAMRDPSTGAWKHKPMSCSSPCTPQVGWDSHNSVTMAFDHQGRLHVSGNMHNNPLRYWRSDVPGEIDSLVHRASMIGTQEASVTYPVFVKGHTGDFIFLYRDGGSGNGSHIINKWNPQSMAWERLLGTNLFSGTSSTGTRSVYFGDNDAGPVAGPPGDPFYHLFWFWRATPDAGSTHRVSYIRSGSLVSWSTGNGTPVTLPIRFDNNPGVIVDDVPQFAGLINRGQIGFDSQRRPIISYHKHDSTLPGGYTQLYNARLENGNWVIYKTTDWPYRWSFGGGGSLVMQIRLGPVTLQPDGRLTQWYSHWQLGRGVLVLNEATLRPDTVLADAYWPAALDTAYRVVNSTSGGSPLQMQVHWLRVRSETDPSVVHALRWETWPENADNPRGVIPPAGQLMYYRMHDPNPTVSVYPARARIGSQPAQVLRVVNGKVVVTDGARASDLRGRATTGLPR